MLDINGEALREGESALLLCEILEISEEGVRIRVMNSEQELVVSVTHDEVLGGLVASSELTAFLNCAEDQESKPSIAAFE